MTIRLLQSWNGYPAGTILNTGDAATEAALIANFTASASLTGGVSMTTAAIDSLPVDGIPKQVLSADYTLRAADDGRQFYAATALTVTIQLGLSPRPSVIIDCPPTGNLSIASSGGALVNGATTTLTRHPPLEPCKQITRHASRAGHGITRHRARNSLPASQHRAKSWVIHVDSRSH